MSIDNSFRPPSLETPRSIIMNVLCDVNDDKVDAIMVVALKKEGNDTMLSLYRSKCNYSDTMAMTGFALEKAIK